VQFFEHQERAKKHTTRLVVLFALGIVGIALVVYAVAVGVLVYGETPDAGARYRWVDGARVVVDAPGPPWFRPGLFALVVGGVLGFVALTAWWRSHTIAKDGRSVAEYLRGRLVPRSTTDPDERKLLNVVEEMALAASMPVPPVYVIEDSTINAFAAGRTAEDSVLGFTRGALLALDRDELQGVVAHEFSHVANGDTRLNLRLMGWIFGIAALGQVGELILRGSFYAGAGRRRRSSEGGGAAAAAIPLIGLALIVLGSIGYFVGRMIQAAVSRQREFLADASAVQFTRNPEGIAGALAKIKAMGSGLSNPRAGEVRHLMFGNPMKRMSSLMATHPPIVERIVRLGATSKLIDVKVPDRAKQHRERVEQEAADRMTLNAGFIAALGEARERLSLVPDELRAATGDAFGACACVLALLRQTSDPERSSQDAALADWPELARELDRLEPHARALPAIERLPVLDLCLPSLAQLTPEQFQRFLAAAEAFTVADRRTDAFEWAIYEVLRARLFPRFGLRARPAATVAFGEALGEVRAVLSWVAAASGSDAERAYRAGLAHLRRSGLPVPVGDGPLSQGVAGSRTVRHADRLRGLVPAERRALVEAAEAVAAEDGRLKPSEAEVVRALAEALGVPVTLSADGRAPVPAAAPGEPTTDDPTEEQPRSAR